MSLAVLSQTLSITLQLCKSLQLSNIDLISATNEVFNVVDWRKNASQRLKAIFSLAKCLNNDALLEKPRIQKRQKCRDNVEANSVEEYYLRSIFIPFLDVLLRQLRDRFLSHKNTILNLLSLWEFFRIMEHSNC